MAYFWKEPDFLLLTLKKKKSLSKSSHGMFIIVRTIETGVSLPWVTTVSIWTPGPDIPSDSALVPHKGVPV